MTQVQAALNGGRMHPAPLTAREIAEECRAAIAAGAFSVHVHPRDAAGRQSLRPEDVSAVVRAAGMVGVTTAACIAPHPFGLIASWSDMPAFASVNMHEHESVAVANLLLARGVGVEAGLATPRGAEVLMRSGLWRRCLRVLIEPHEKTLSEALATVRVIEEIVQHCPLPRILHGADATAWPLLEEAARRGLDTRMGLEDTLTMPDGTPAQGNAVLIEAAREIIARYG